MSSPDTATRTGPASSTRNPRRRARPDTEEAGSLRQQPQRKRSKLNRDAHQATAKKASDGDASQPKQLVNGQAPLDENERSASPPPLGIPHRSKPRAEAARRSAKDDSAVFWTKTDFYSMKPVTSLPQQIRPNSGVPYRGARIHASGYALILTASQALVWDYTSTATVPPIRTFNLSHSAQVEDPLPLGAFVTSGVAGEVGLVVVNATNGKVSYWENLENADALSLFEQRRNGIEGSCGNLLSGETIVDIEDAGPAGFVLTFSTGRTAQLLVRDGQSRPAISISFLRRQNNSGGFLSGLKNVFGGSYWLKSIASVRCHAAQSRGQTNVVIAHEDAAFQTWQLSWNSQPVQRHEFDARSAIAEALSALSESATRGSIKDITTVDFAIADGDDDYLEIALLVNVADVSRSYYALLKLSFQGSAIAVSHVTPLHTYWPSLRPETNRKPQICLPGFKRTAIIAFEKAITLVSLENKGPGSSSKSSGGEDEARHSFQDTVYFREGDNIHTCGIAEEPNAVKQQRGSAVVFLSHGALHVIANKIATTHSRLSIKSKIEQAVFYGNVASNPLDLFHEPTESVSIKDVEEAALQISQEVLSTSPAFDAVITSMADNLDGRAQNLRDIATYITKLHLNVSRATRWRLRWDAEKMAAAQVVWAQHDTDRVGPSLLSEMIGYMHDDIKTVVPEEERDKIDPVRYWFFKDISKMGTLLSWPEYTIELAMDDHKDMVEIQDVMLASYTQANDIVVGGLQTAFAFRTEHAGLYGLENEVIADDLLLDGYKDLPEFWTSAREGVVLTTQAHIHLARKFLEENSQITATETFFDPRAVKNKIVHDDPYLVDLFCKMNEEQLRWRSAQDDEEIKSSISAETDDYHNSRQGFLIDMPDVSAELWDHAMTLAEKYNDMEALVGLMSWKTGAVVQDPSASEAGGFASRTQDLEKRIGRYLRTYGERFANVMYASLLRSGSGAALLDQMHRYGDEVTRFLRAESDRGRMSWINDTLSEQDYSYAGETLMQVAKNQEDDFWNKKVELSLAKLAFLSADPTASKSEKVSKAKTELNDEMQLLLIQQRVYEHIRPKLYDAIDQPAELQLAMDYFGKRTGFETPFLNELLQRGFEKLVRLEALNFQSLIDILTLMDHRHCDLPPSDIFGLEILLALEVLTYAGFSSQGEEFKVLLSIIWRRCFITDQWNKVKEYNLDQTDKDAIVALQSTALFQTLYHGYRKGLWDGASGVKTLYPTEVLGKGTTSDELSGRFSSVELRNRLAEDMAKEDALLQSYVHKAQLDGWFKAAKDLAEKRVKEEKDAEVATEEERRNLLSGTHAADDDLSKLMGRVGLTKRA